MLRIPANGEIDGKNTTPADGGANPLPEQNQSAIDPTLPDTPLAADFAQTNLTQQMTENQSADEAEFADYQKILGAENLPETFAEFQEMKYNEPEVWGNLETQIESENARIEDAFHAIQEKGVTTTDKQFGKKIGKHLEDYELDPSDANAREFIREKINNIIDSAELVKVVWWRGQGDGGKEGKAFAYLVGQEVVLVSLDGRFITIMNQGINNERFKKGRSMK